MTSAFGVASTAKVTGFSERRLRRWDREGWYSPSYGDPERPEVFGGSYSYADLVRLRTAAALMERGVPVRRALAAVGGRSPLDQQEIPVETLYVADGQVVARCSDDQAVAGDGEAVEPRALSAEVDEGVRLLGVRAPEQIGTTERRRGWVNGWEVFAGTRIPMLTIIDLLENGWSRSEILTSYDRLRDADLDLAEARLREQHALAS